MSTLQNKTLEPPQPGRWKMLNLSWVAFFLTFVVWYNLAAFSTTIARALHLTIEQSQVLLLCNLSLTIPARIGVGMLVDRFGPRRVYSALLLFAAFPCLAIAFSTEFWQLVTCRLLISCVGAGFVVGIRMVGEWFDAREIGMAEGIYGGLGNFGMAAATFGLPLLALLFGAENGWRWATAISGLLCAVWAVVFYLNAVDSPPGKPFARPRKPGALEVTSRGDLLGLVFMQVPMALCLGVTAWRLHRVGFLSSAVMFVIFGLLALLLGQQVRKILSVNRTMIAGEPVADDERYSFGQVAILCLCYAVTFGGELAVEQMLPGYFEKMFNVSVAVAGIMGAGFAFANFVARPLGGILGDRVGRKPVMIATLGGSALGFIAILQIDKTWHPGAAMALVIFVGIFLMAANGAAFCIAPLIRKPLTGQIAGLIGAYGSVGSVAFTTILLMTTPTTFFVSIAAVACIAFACTFLIVEPGTRPAVAKDEEPVAIDAVALEVA